MANKTEKSSKKSTHKTSDKSSAAAAAAAVDFISRKTLTTTGSAEVSFSLLVRCMAAITMIRPVLLLLLLLPGTVLAQNQRFDDANFDQFSYLDDIQDRTNMVYPPQLWHLVRCGQLEDCLGWPDSFEPGVGWELERNSCLHCPAGTRRCGTHHQSPINLERNRAVEGHDKENPCIDVHWMAYHDSSCTFELLKQFNAFSIERHALKVVQPVEEVEKDQYRNACHNAGRRWGRIDFSKGFSQWWHLSHMDVHVPSEHTQEGKTYSGEIHLYHFYSVSGDEAGVDNEMASVTFFLEAFDNAPDYDVLNRLICQWRKVEEETRRHCNLPSVIEEYPGCYTYARGHVQQDPTMPVIPNTTIPDLDETLNHSATAQGVEHGHRSLEEQAAEADIAPHPRKKALSAQDIILHNWLQGYTRHENVTRRLRHGKKRLPKKTLVMDDSDYEEADPDFDWDEFIAQQYRQEQDNQHGRKLLDYNHVGPWFNYFPLIGVKTEYYYRYSGTQTVPPCYGRFSNGANRANTNHWRVMKDPIRTSQRQIDELHRLIKNRIAPADDPIRPCRPDTAAKPDGPNKVSVARPLQSNHNAHFKVFCECENWGSKWQEDREWCRLPKSERFYEQPYNFKTDGF